MIGPYLVVGHVPVDLIDRLLAEKPAACGIAVAGMPGTAPGMDVPGSRERYDVVLFTAAGKMRVYGRM